MHAANESGPLNDTVAAWMARYPLVTIEKIQAISADPPNKQAEEKIMAALDKVKAINPNTRGLFYLNTILNFKQYSLADRFFANEQLLLHDASGRLANLSLRGNHLTIFDLSSEAARRLWLETIDDALTKSKIDGVFADRGRARAEIDLRSINLTEAKRAIWNEGHAMLIRELMMLVSERRPQTGIVIPNGADFVGVNGRMFESIRCNDTHSVPPNNDILALQAEEQAGRIAEVHSDNCSPGTSAFNVSLAAYLVGAVNYSYYGCTEGWTVQSGWLIWPAEYSKPLGAPLAAGVLKNGTWTRSFAKGTRVWLDQVNCVWSRPCIHWGDDTWTGKHQDCARHVRNLRGRPHAIV